MSRSPAPALAALAAFFLCSSSEAQEPAAVRAPRADRLLDSPLSLSAAGLHLLDGRLVGCGARYKVTFDEQGFELTPAFGRAAPRSCPLSFRVAEIARGDERTSCENVAPTWHDLRVEYDRGVAIERYDVGVDAMEQSFVFAERPDGTGDLVVRGQLATDLRVERDGAGLRLLLAGLGHLGIGGVTGVDARGRRVEGSVRYAEGLIELTLPAEFVDAAALPFTLDPPIGNVVFAGGPSSADYQVPYVAYDASTDLYLAIWTHILSGTNFDILGQRLRIFGGTALRVGGTVIIENSSSIEDEPQVCNCDAMDAFVVSYTRDGDVIGRAVSAATASISPPLVIAGGPASVQHYATLAANIGRDDVVCCWQSDGHVALQATAVQVNSNLALSLPGPVHTFADTSLVSSPAIKPRLSKSDGGMGRHALAFQRDFSGGANSDVRFLILDRAGAPIVAEGGSLDATAADDELPEVDGDGTNWVVAWQRTAAVNNHDIVAMSLSFDAASGLRVANSAIVPVAIGSSDQGTPSATWIGDSAIVGWMQQEVPNTARWGARALPVDPFTCGHCELFSFEYRFQSPAGYELSASPFGCGAFAGDPTRVDQALFVWELNPQGSGFNGDILAQAFEAEDGAVTSLGGGCGRDGVARATCAALNNSGFRHRLRGAPPLAATALFLSPVQGTFSCGPCTLKPSLTFLLAVGTTTNQHGHAEIALAIPFDPALRGISTIVQWITVQPTGGACLLYGIDFSNALDVRIE